MDVTKTKQIVETTPGYFIVLDETEKKEMEEKMQVKIGRAGIFYEKKELIATIMANSVLKAKEMLLIEIEVTQRNIVNLNDKKFGIKCGNGIPITKIEHFTDAVKSCYTNA